MFRKTVKAAKGFAKSPLGAFLITATATTAAIVGSYYLSRNEEENYSFGLAHGIKAGKHDAKKTNLHLVG